MTGRPGRESTVPPQPSSKASADKLIREVVPGAWKSTVALAIAYFFTASISLLSTRVHGDIAYCWIATAVLMPRLAQLRWQRWLAPVGACAVASMIASSVFGAGASVAGPFAVLLVGEAAIGALLLQRFAADGQFFDDVPRVLRFALIVGAMPVLSAFGGAAMGVLAFGMTFWSSWLAWYTVHTLGAVTFIPIVVLVTEQTGKRRLSGFSPRHGGGTNLMLAILTAIVAALVFGQNQVPLLFLPMLPLTLLTFRTGSFGAALGICIIATVGGVLTLAGYGPINVASDSYAVRHIFFQFYLAITVATIIPMAAELNRRKALTGRLKDSEAMFRLMSERSGDVVFNLDVEGRIRYCSPSITLFGDFDPAALVGRKFLDLIDEDDRIVAAAVHGRALSRPDETFVFEYRVLTVFDEPIWFESHTRAIVDTDGILTGVVSAARDVSHRKRAEAKLLDAVNTDSLTGIGNRRRFDERLRQAVNAPDRRANGGCLAIVDIDYFKQVNDRNGHQAGDEVLKAVAARLQPMLRSTDLVARIGGEEFGLVLWNLQAADADKLCDRLREDIAMLRVDVGTATLRITVSIGIAEILQHNSVPELVGAADRALYRAKREGRNCVRLAA